MTTADFLFEIQCEELPPKALNDLRLSLHNSVKSQLNHENIQSFATPRRLAVLISHLPIKQADQVIQKRGPAITQAYDQDGHPTKACLGFLKSCNADAKDLKILKTDQGEWVYCEQHIPGKYTKELMPEILTQAIKQLPVPKWMRWGNHTEQFARPVHHIVLMCDDKVIDTTILGIKTGNITQGHRFLAPSSSTASVVPANAGIQDLIPANNPAALIKITHAKNYEQILRDNFVIADFEKRRNEIKNQIINITKPMGEFHLEDEDPLLNEVTGLVEWPTAHVAQFDQRFLKVPSEALISAMKEHQKSFPVIRELGNTLTNQFIFISNIAPKDPSIMIKGNEKVMTARLSDAEFFYQTDLKTKLIDRVEQLKTVTFQKQLGSLHDKALRLAELCDFISNHHPEAKRTGLLAKTDLLTNMVCEFTELQGIMGYYYAQQDGEKEEIVIALGEQYLPRFSTDKVAGSKLGIALSIADKLDNLVGFFGINLVPTGTKDPFALRRAALGIISIIIRQAKFKKFAGFKFDLKELIEASKNNFTITLPNKNITNDLLEFFYDRLRVWLKEPKEDHDGFDFDIIDSVLSLKPTNLDECYLRISAVNNFKKLPEAESLAAANKRVANILQKNTEPLSETVDIQLFEKPAETNLYQAILAQEKTPFQNYNETLMKLATLRPAIDQFFDEVMVNAEERAIRLNRLALLNRLRELFLKVADIAYLQKIQ